MFARVRCASIVALPVLSLFTLCQISEQEIRFGEGGATPSVAVNSTNPRRHPLLPVDFYK